MKTFTNCAEKKANQILNLLQKYTKSIRITAILMLLLVGVNNAWAYTAHFSLMGEPIGNWNSDRDFMINTSTGTTDEWYIYVYVKTNQYFALHNGSDQYGPETNGSAIKNGTGGGQGKYNSNSWKYTGNNGIIKICCAESNNREWYPWVWVEEAAPTIKFKHPWNGGSWTEKTATKQSDGTYTYDDQYGNNKGFNAGPSGKYKYNGDKTTLVGSPAKGDKCRFRWNPDGYVQGGAETKACGTFTITKLCALTYNGNGNTGGTVPSKIENIEYNNSITLSSTVLTKTGYTHTGWNTKADGSGTDYAFGASLKLTNTNFTLYAKWTQNATYSLLVEAGAGIQSVTGSKDPVTLGSSYSITATLKTGYTFSTWTANPAANATFTSATTANTNVTVKNGSVTVTATATENKSSLTTSNKYDVGNPGYAVPEADKTEIGYETTATVKATAAGNGYTFTGWTLTNCTRTDNGAANATTITVRSNGDSKNAEVIANYEEELATTQWYISGNGNGSGTDLTSGSPFTGWGTNGTQMFKKSGHSTEEIYYCTIIANTVASSDDQFPFKVYNATTDKYWGNNGYWVTKENNHPTLSSNSGSNMKFRPYLVGTYEFKLDNTGASPILTVTWPVYNQLRISAANPADATNTGEFDMTGSGIYTVTRNLNANTTYTFKIVYDSEWYGASSGNLTRTSSSKTLSTSSNDLTIQTDVAGNYTFTFNSSDKKLSVTYPEAYVVTYSHAPTAAADAPTTNPSVTSDKYVAAGTSVTFTAKDAKTGYTFKGWYDNDAGTGTALTTDKAYTRTINADTKIYAVYTENKFKVVAIANRAGYGTVTPNTATTMSEIYGGDITASAKNGYRFDNWTIKSGSGYFGATGINTTSTVPNTKFRPSADSEVQANFSVVTYTITYNLDGGTNHANNPGSYTIESTTITLHNPTKMGYTFAGWYTESNFSNTPVTEITQGSTGDKTFYANWTENTVIISPTNAYDKGNPEYANPTASNDGKIGISSTSELVAPAPEEGYTFAGWTLSDNIDVTSGDPVTSRTIIVRHKTGDGSAVSAVANYKENLNSHWHLVGNNVFPDRWTVSDNNEMKKRSGFANEEVVYMTLSFSAGQTYEFKVVNDNGSENTNDYTWYGYSTGDTYLVWTETSTKKVYTGNGNSNNLKFTASIAGEYEFKVDYSGDYPEVTITYPTVNMSLVGTFNNWEPSTNLFAINGLIATASIHLDAGIYEFKINDDGIWRTMSAASRVITRDANQNINFNTTGGSSNNTILNADAGGTYTFIYNKSSQTLTVEYPDISIHLVGEFTNGNYDDNYKFTEDPAKPGIYVLKSYFAKRERYQAQNANQAEYEFKLNINGKSYTVEGDGNQKILQYTRQNTTKVVNDGTDYSEPYYYLLLQADQDGLYTFTYDSETRILTVEHPKYDPEASYIVGDFSDGTQGTDDMPKDGGAGHDWTEKYGKPFENRILDCIKFENGTWNFKIKINGIWYGANGLQVTTSGTYTLDDNNADLEQNYVTLKANGEDGCYYFEYTENPDGTLSVLIIYPNDTRTVTFNMNGHGEQVREQHVLYHKNAVKPQVSDVDGYLFAGWYTDATCTTEYDFNTPVIADISLFAKWISYEDCIFFKNNLNWDEVYVYFYSSDKYWDDSKGTGSLNEKEINGSKAHYREFRGQMTQIGKTDIWYFDYISAAKSIDATHWTEIKTSKNIAFTEHKQYNYDFFDNTKVIRRGDFSSQLQLFIPQSNQAPTLLNKHDGVSTKYYNKGLWMKYNSTESGYNWSSDVGGWDNSKNFFTSDNTGGYSFTAEVELQAGSTYEFKIHNKNGTWFGNPSTMTQDNCTNWWFKEEVNDNAHIKPTVTGTYIFTVYLGNGEVRVSLDYPLSKGDYRLAYMDNQIGSFHPGHYIKKRSTDQYDTVSFFINHDLEPQVVAQRCTAIDAQGNATWKTITEITLNPAYSINESGVYNFTLAQIAGQTDPILLNETRPYTGNYYIRTTAADGGWKSFRQERNLMTYNSYAAEKEDFDYYFCKWVDQDKGIKNVSYTVANDYSYCISDTLFEDIDATHPKIVTNTKGDLPIGKSANVRWGWNSKTNKIRRAYLAGSGHKKDRFLVLEGNKFLRDIDGNSYTGQTAEGEDRYNLKDNEVVFDDMGNWIYQMDVKANKNTKIDLTALYNGEIQYFKGGSAEGDEIPMIVTTSNNENYYKIRLIYDFKINNLIIAWLPDDETTLTDTGLQVEMMTIRRNQEHAQQLNFETGVTELTGITKAYAVMTFDKYFLNNKNQNTGNALPESELKSENERMFYWISFPFDVKISDIIAFGEYGDYWIMEYYDGEARAKEGYWAETETFWKYITNKNYTLKAGQGYVLCLNLNKMKYESTVFANTSEVSIYFPSTSKPSVCSEPISIDVPTHTCTIERDNRNIYDSNWNLIGIPAFADIKNIEIGESYHKEINADCISFYYKYSPADNKYSATTQTETFQTMYAYMVQFAGIINWQSIRTPTSLAARRTGSMPSQLDLRLELAHGEQTDQTFVQLKEADATTEFDMNIDMTKIFNSGMNIYTLTGSNAIQVAGNALPMVKATIPVGIVIHTAGTYTLRMPDGTDGISVTLVDNATGTHTDMLLNEYTVTLDAGTIENRFYLVVDPDRAATSVENVGEEAKGVKKFLIDGKLIIRTADGIFDAQGHKL